MPKNWFDFRSRRMKPVAGEIFPLTVACHRSRPRPKSDRIYLEVPVSSSSPFHEGYHIKNLNFVKCYALLGQGGATGRSDGLTSMEHHGILQSMPARKPIRQARKQPSNRSTSPAHAIPGWARLREIDIPVRPDMKPGGPRHRITIDPYLALEGLLIMLWDDVSHEKRKRLYPNACWPASLSRMLRRWVPDDEDKKAAASGADKVDQLRIIWRQYLALLTATERKQWRAKLEDQANAWKSWKRAPRIAVRVFSPWFKSILDEARRGPRR